MTEGGGETELLVFALRSFFFAPALAPEWTQGPVREVHLVGQSDDVECFDGGADDDGGPHVVTAGLDRAVRVWEVATGECIHTFGSLPSRT